MSAGPAGAAGGPATAIPQRFGDYGGRFVPEVLIAALDELTLAWACLLYTSPSPRDISGSRMPSSA